MNIIELQKRIKFLEARRATAKTEQELNTIEMNIAIHLAMLIGKRKGQ